ncbi:MAG: class B sortase [Oscillospiraceae bacterium]|nr:class B sortase [Oscillospiraceae bacterium]
MLYFSLIFVARFDPVARRSMLFAPLIAIGVFLIALSSYRLIENHLEGTAARAEYQELRDIFEMIAIMHHPLPQAPEIHSDGQPELPDAVMTAEHATPLPDMLQGLEGLEDPMETLRQINPDLIGWIRIENLINYPIVQGRDNSRYLNTTFQGRRNASGAIFMDYRNSSVFDDEVSIIYGHNMRNGSMFAPLHRLRDPAFLAEHQYIRIILSAQETLVYRIVAARVVNVWYTVNDPTQLTAAAVAGSVRGAPSGTQRFLILSTCTNVDDDERLRIYAALIEPY